MAKKKAAKTTAKNKKTKSMGKIYHKKTEIDGIVFDSQTEAEYYEFLKKQKADGIIDDFTMQDTFVLQDKYIIVDGQRYDESDKNFKKIQKANPGCTVQAIKYIADFMVYHKNGKIQVVDVKGQKTVDFKIKEKMFNFKFPQYNGLYCVVKYRGQWMEYKQAEKEKKAAKKNKK